MADHSDVTEIASLLPDFSALPERSKSYFLPDPSSIEIALSELVSTRLRPEGVRNAARLMADAAAGRTDRRKPVEVARRDDGRWDVLDGNSTVAVGRSSGWRSIPCLATTAGALEPS